MHFKLKPKAINSSLNETTIDSYLRLDVNYIECQIATRHPPPLKYVFKHAWEELFNKAWIQCLFIHVCEEKRGREERERGLLFCLHTSCLRLQISMNIFPQLFRLVRQKKRKSWIAKLISFLFNDLHLSCSQSKK